ncbi:unnamed protein product [Rotaria sp. Silwood2]|nr:unnamed protein product [Rotaria sp. Silwood2]CAF2711347.1 unnamed protein product [Rotaria sp. Silwood2]CAF2984365.1 unnamed protein product [Rotaria sp. Silwood2]CAF3140583.1 unnamed protein product [Rotaria sp. Silwood2]CAF4207944.1 unnamed protein product [Rotaria sp. Silwood2]
MFAAGFSYTGDGDTVRCDKCQLEVSEWTQDMEPKLVHAERSPNCPFVCSTISKSFMESNDQENPTKRQKTESNLDECMRNYKFEEVNKLKLIRCRTFSHWSHQIKPSVEQMINAGFFSCNVADRVICLYCNLICQQWKADIDDPTEVHKTLSPRCPYVLSILIQPERSTVVVLNSIPTNHLNNQNFESPNAAQFQFDQIVHTTPLNPAYSEITKRLQSFATCSHESLPPVDELIRAGFFHTGAQNIVTCFYCNGSLKNWTANDNPLIEHVRWFPHCGYAKQVCGDELYRKIQEAKRALQERNRANRPNETGENGNSLVSNHCQLQINDANILSRLVAARLDLSSSQRLLDRNYKLSVIKRCWEDQLQLKKDDFISDADLFIACTVLQKQIDHIQGNKENIIIPSVQMKLICERKQSGLSTLSTHSNSDNVNVLQSQTAPETPKIESTTTTTNKEISTMSETNSTRISSITNPCIICYQDEKQLACIPCGHLTACVSCSRTLRTCPTCRKEIEAFVRVYI